MSNDGKVNEASLETRVQAERARGLYARAPTAFTTNVAIAALLVVLLLLRGVANPVLAWSWLGAMCILTAGRWVLVGLYRRRAPLASLARRWAARFTVGTAMNGLLWGLVAVALYPPGGVIAQVVLLVVLAGMTAGAAMSTATYFPAFLAYAAPALAPITVRLALEGDGLHAVLAAMAAVFGVAMSRIAGVGERTLVDSVRLQIRNAALVDELSEARARLARSNADLEARVTARTAELIATLEQQQRAEVALRRQKELLQKIFDHCPVMLVLLDGRGGVDMSNRECERLLGWSGEEQRGGELTAKIGADPSERERMKSHLQQAAAVWADFTCRARDGRLLFVSWASVPLSDGVTMAIGQDVTERHKAHDAIVLSARIASVGTLAAGVAHEINNPLAFVVNNLEFTAAALRNSLEALAVTGPGAPHLGRLRRSQEAIADALIGTTRVANIVRDLRTFSRGVDDQGELVPLVEVLEMAIRMAAHELKHRAQVVREFGPVPPVMAQRDRLGQVFLNLLVNAAQAIPEGNALGNEVRIVAWTDAAGRAVVEVRDTGAGIAPDVLPRILDPFFTTKPVGQGTGLGLSICHGIVSALGGRLEAESAPGRGSTFRVVLPPSPAAPLLSPAPVVAPPPAGAARLLVIDDEPRFASAIERLVGDRHEVVVETRARAALARIEAGERFDVILCDLMMPEVTGMEFVELLARTAPLLAERVAFVTGGAFTDRAREFLERVGNPRITKPFSREELEELIESVLRGRR